MDSLPSIWPVRRSWRRSNGASDPAAGIQKRVYPHLFRHQIITFLTKKGIISPKLQLLSGHAEEKSLAMYRDLALADVSAEYEAAMQSLPVHGSGYFHPTGRTGQGDGHGGPPDDCDASLALSEAGWGHPRGESRWRQDLPDQLRREAACLSPGHPGVWRDARRAVVRRVFVMASHLTLHGYFAPGDMVIGIGPPWRG
jgi:hypothetical protein